MIYICDLDTMESVGKQDKFSGRLNHHRIKVNKIYDWMYDFKDSKVAPGIIESSGKDWQEQRRFALQVINFQKRFFLLHKVYFFLLKFFGKCTRKNCS